MSKPTPKPTPSPTPSKTPPLTVNQDAILKALVDKLGGGDGGTSLVNKVYLGGNLGTKTVKMKKTGKEITVPVTTATIADAKKMFVNDAALRSRWTATLKKYGLESANPLAARTMWDMAVEGAADWYQTSGGKQKVTPEQYVGWYAKGKEKQDEPNLPQRQVYMYDKATVLDLIDRTLQNTLGRKATADENKSFYTAIQDMIEEGTVTTTKTQINPITGKKEMITTTKPGFSQERAQSYIESQVIGTEDYKQKMSLDFADFLFGNQG